MSTCCCRSCRTLQHLGATLIVLGDGEQALADALTAAAAAHTQQVAFIRADDEALAHQLFGGADVFAMPSRFEPCGLAQMQSMRYGTLPLVTDVGGLHDTVDRRGSGCPPGARVLWCPIRPRSP